MHLALREGGPALQDTVKEALLKAYFVDAENVADHAVLSRIATGAGIDGDRVDAVLASDELRDEVWADVEQAQAYGATGVPYFVVDHRYGVSGAQPSEVRREVLDRAWADTHPALQMVGAGEGDEACGPDGCAI